MCCYTLIEEERQVLGSQRYALVATRHTIEARRK
jgi:hypothetical protein